MSLELGNVAEWLAAVGTVGALAVALVLLRKDLADREAARERELRHQAEQIGTWVGVTDAGYTVNVKNGSPLPVYNMTVTVGTPAGHDPWTQPLGWTTLGPDEADHQVVPHDASPTGAVIVYCTHFTDSAGRSWERTASGQLERIADLDYIGCS